MQRNAVGAFAIALVVAGCAADSTEMMSGTGNGTNHGPGDGHRGPARRDRRSALDDSGAAGAGGAGQHTMTGGMVPGAGGTMMAGGMVPGAGGSTPIPLGTGGGGAGHDGRHRRHGGRRSGHDGRCRSPAVTEPTIPAVSGDCPSFDASGTITFMGLGGIWMVEVGLEARDARPRRWSSTGTARARLQASTHSWRPTSFNGVIAEGGVLISFQDTTGGDLLSGTAIFGMSDFALYRSAARVRRSRSQHRSAPRLCHGLQRRRAVLGCDGRPCARATWPRPASNSGGWTAPVCSSIATTRRR